MEKSISEWTAHRSWARPHGGYSIRGCFLATIWPHITTWTLFKPTWVMLPDYVYPYMTTVCLFLMTPSSRIEAQIISHWFVEHVSEFRTLSYWTESWWLSKNSTFEMRLNWSLHHGWPADKFAATAWCCYVNVDQNQRPVESMQRRIETVQKPKGCPPWSCT